MQCVVFLQFIDDVAKEIQKYKALLDAGMITEEEFTAKNVRYLEYNLFF